MMIEFLPKLPPLGDVSTELGLFRLAVARIIHHIDDHLRFCYPHAGDTIEILLDGFSGFSEDNEELIRRQLIIMATTVTDAYTRCTNPECAYDNRHELMKEVAKLIEFMPSQIFEECMSKGIVVGQSMN